MTAVSRTRIWVSCDTSPLGAAALEAAALLARQWDAELAGLFVEDANLLRMAALPFACEVALASAAPRRIDVSEVEQALRRQADAMRVALSRAAQASHVPWSFQVVRGSLMDSLFAEMREPGLAVLGHSGQFAGNGHASRARNTVNDEAHAYHVHHASHAGSRTLLVLHDNTETARRALGVAIEWARRHRNPLVILLAASSAGDRAAIRASAEMQLDSTGLAARYQDLPSRDIRLVKQAALALHAAAVFWPGISGTAVAGERKSLATLVDELTCPVMLVT